MATQIIETTEFTLLITQDYQGPFHQAQGQVITGINKRGLDTDQPPVLLKYMLAFVRIDGGIVVIIMR